MRVEPSENRSHNESITSNLIPKSNTQQFIEREIEKAYEHIDLENFSFKPVYFFKFFLLSLIFIAFGPLTYFFICWKKNLLTLVRNLGFLGGKGEILRTALWIFRWYAIAITVIPSNNNKYSNLMVNLYLLVITEISLAVLYAAYYSSFRYSEIEKMMTIPDHKVGEGSISDQLDQLNRSNNEHMFDSKQLNLNFPDVDLNMFYFAVPVTEKDKLPSSLTATERNYQPEFFEDVKECVLVDGVAVAKLILGDLKGNLEFKGIGFSVEKLISRLIVIIRILYPIISQIIEIYTKIINDPGSKWTDFFTASDITIVIAFFCYIFVLCRYYIIYDVLFMGMTLYIKKLKIMQAVSNLIEGGTENIGKLHFSTFIPQNITNWVNLRRILAQSNAQIHTIVDVNLSFVLCFLAVVIAFLLADALGNIPFPSILKDHAFAVVTATYLLIMIALIIAGMVLGIYINDYFHSHQNLLIQKLDLVKNLNDFTQFYVHSMSQVEEKLAENKNDRYLKQLAELRDILRNDAFLKRYSDHLRKVIEVLQHSIKRLQWEEVERPNTILGIKTTTRMLIALGSGLTVLGVTNIKMIIDYAEGNKTK